MPNIYLKHPIHGAKVAFVEAEAEADEENGWVRYTYDTPSVIKESINDVEEAAPVNKLDVKRRRKPTV